MVAETENLPPAKPRKKPQFGPGNPYPLAVKLTIRSFYVLQGLQPSQIAPMVNLTTVQVANLVRREGWSKLRGEKRAQRETKAISRQDAHADEQIKALHEGIAIHTEDLSVKTLDHCANILSRTVTGDDGKEIPWIDSKELQMASGAAKNFVQIARMSRGLDQRNGPQNSQGDGAAHQTLIFVGALERAAPKQERNVTEVSAKPVPDSPPALPA